MGFREIFFRLSGELKKNYEKRFIAGKTPQFKALPKDPQSIFSASREKLKDGPKSKIALLDFELDTNNKIDFHRDPATGGCYKKEFYGDIDIRFDRKKSAKRVWEISRLQFLPYIAKRAEIQKTFAILSSWQEENPYLTSVNWYSAMEAALRLVSFVLTWEALDFNKICLKSRRAKEFRNKIWLPLIYSHVRYLSSHLSAYSSANNHIIIEAAGLYISSVFWIFPESEKWQRRSRDILEKEIVRQHSPSGVNREEASGYVQFVLDALIAAKIAEKNSKNKFSGRYSSMLKKISRFSADLTDAHGNIADYGDNDNGKFIPPGLIEAGRIRKSPNSSFYKNEGHFFFKKQLGSKEIFMHFNAAPLGYLSTAAHGHADALSFTLNIDGRQYLVDSGTYIYHGAPKWRRYFVGTLAHNTIRIDKKDQAQFIGPTLWGKKYKCKVIATSQSKSREMVIAKLSGLANVAHTRKVLFEKKSDRITVADQLLPQKKGGHLFEFCLHLHPEAKIIKLSAHTYSIQRQGSRKIILRLDKRFAFQTIHGDESKPLGWYSPRFHVKIPSTAIYNRTFAKEKLSINIIIEVK